MKNTKESNFGFYNETLKSMINKLLEKINKKVVLNESETKDIKQVIQSTTAGMREINSHTKQTRNNLEFEYRVFKDVAKDKGDLRKLLKSRNLIEYKKEEYL
jgi:hypothetical protein